MFPYGGWKHIKTNVGMCSRLQLSWNTSTISTKWSCYVGILDDVDFKPLDPPLWSTYIFPLKWEFSKLKNVNDGYQETTLVHVVLDTTNNNIYKKAIKKCYGCHYNNIMSGNLFRIFHKCWKPCINIVTLWIIPWASVYICTSLIKLGVIDHWTSALAQKVRTLACRSSSWSVIVRVV